MTSKELAEEALKVIYNKHMESDQYCEEDKKLFTAMYKEYKSKN